MERMQFDPATPREWSGLGDMQEIDPDRQRNAEAQHLEGLYYAQQSNTHLWVVVVMHRATEQMLAAFSDPESEDMPILDAETLAMPPGVACYRCGEAYSKRESFRKCKGDIA